MSYELSVVVDGPGLSPNARSHWVFMITKAGQTTGELLHVRVLDLATLRYQFEERIAPLESATIEGRWKVTSLTYAQRLKAKDIIRKVAAPADGKKRCQDWVLDVFIELEAEELIPSDSSHQCSNGIGKSAADLGSSLGAAWVRKSK